MRRRRELAGWLAGAVAIAAGVALSGGHALADVAPPPEPCVAGPATPTDHIYPLPKANCSIEGMAVSIDDGDFRSLYGPTVVYGSGRADEIVGLLDRIDANLRADLVAARGQGRKLRILLYAHGGRVNHDDAVAGAQAIAPGALADGAAPVFLIWNSDMLDSYRDRLCCVLDGQKSTRAAFYFVPTRLAGDLAAGVARAPEHWGEQVLRFDDSVVKTGGTPDQLSSQDTGRLAELFWRGSGGHVFYPALGDGAAPGSTTRDLLNAGDQPPVVSSIGYRALFPVRIVTTGFSSVGAEDWDDMLRRTRLAVQPSLQPSLPLAVAAGGRGARLAAPEDCDQRTRHELGGRQPGGEDTAPASRSGPATDVEHEGGFAVFINHLACEVRQGFGVAGATADDVEIDFYGHSMGAIVGDEIISAHPELPWRRIVYMAAADSVRDARASLGPLLACAGVGPRDRCLGNEARFYGLMLHPLAESHDLEGTALLPEGSLLEWVDEMFAGPLSVDDRRFGKWTNVEKGLAFFPANARQRMYFRVFPAQADLRRASDPAERALYARQCGAAPGALAAPPKRCHPIVHGEFTTYSFWRDKFLCDVGDAAAPGPDGPDCAGDDR